MDIRRGPAVLAALALVVAGYSAGQASDKDRAVVTVQVSSAEHEVQEGYFSLGADTTLMVKPGTELHRFLSRQRGRNVTITFTEGTARHLSRLDRD